MTPPVVYTVTNPSRAEGHSSAWIRSNLDGSLNYLLTSCMYCGGWGWASSLFCIKLRRLPVLPYISRLRRFLAIQTDYCVIACSSDCLLQTLLHTTHSMGGGVRS